MQTETSVYVIANASVTLYDGANAASGADCSITTGSTIDGNATLTGSAASNRSNTIAETRGFQVNKVFVASPDTLTVNVCAGVGGSPVLRDLQLTAIFAPDPDAYGFVVVGP